jgi:hypothetical protein
MFIAKAGRCAALASLLLEQRDSRRDDMPGARSVTGRAEVAEVEAFLKAHPDIEAAKRW